MVCCGVMVSFGLPAKASQPAHGVANWLKSLTGTNVSPRLARQLQSISQSNKGLNRLLKRATEIISKNNKDFNFVNSATQAAIHQILLIKWNQYKSGNSMSAVPPVQVNKYPVPPFSQILPKSHHNSLTRRTFNDIFCGKLQKTYPQRLRIQVIPLINKISIGAP